LRHLEFGFLEDQDFLPNETRKQDVAQTPVNTNLPIGSDIGSVSRGSNMNDHDENDFGEMNPRSEDPTNMMTVGVF
jgi:hypothetical protein